MDMTSSHLSSSSSNNSFPTAREEAMDTAAGCDAYSDFLEFFERWTLEQDAYLERLLAVSCSNGHESEERLHALVSRVVEHYEEYYKAKTTAARRDVLPMFCPKWISATENLFQWFGGWQPSSACHLLYSKQGLQLLNRLEDVLEGVLIGDLADMSPLQLRQFDTLQRQVIASEREISEIAANTQSRVADSTVVELSHIITETKRPQAQSTQGHHEHPAEREMAEDMEEKKEDMLKVLEEADRLRMNTIRGVIGILRPLQSVHFLIAAAEVHLRVHEWGMKHDQVRAQRSR